MIVAKNPVSSLWFKKNLTRTRPDQLREILIKFDLRVRAKVPI